MPAPAQSPAQLPAQWRGFLRALIEELDASADPHTRDLILRGIGARMAQMAPMQSASSITALQLEMNDALAGMQWGSVRLELREAEHCLLFIHVHLPRISWAGDPPGTWLAPVLGGLYETWMGQQPGADPALVARIYSRDQSGAVVLRYGL
jgi:hypothetical protein